MPKVIAYIPLMYGAEYLEACIKSMHDHVEKIIVVYVDKPSQGNATTEVCPEGEEMLRDIAESASNKIKWYKSQFRHEGEHRSYINKFTKGYDLVFTLDADEVAEPNDIEHALKLSYETDKRYIGIGGFINYWRSFSWACHDGFTPIRIINLKNREGTQGVVPMRVYHFSTAQKEEIIRYKWNISGHASELRPNWIDEILYKWTPENNFPNLHPVAHGIWNATPFDKNTLPDILKQHPNFNKELI
jgi:hypothetical protein